MATNFPTSVDALTNPVSNDSLNSPSHSAQHANANDAIEAVEDYLLNGAGKTGLVHLVTATSTAATFIEAQNVFTSAYNNYRIEFWGLAPSTGDFQLNLQLLNGSTPITSGYVYGMFYVNTSGANGTFGSSNSASVYAFGQYGTASYNSSASIDILNPFQTRMTSFNGLSANTYGASASAFIYSGGYQTSATAYNGVRINGNTSNLTGEMRIYGYRNS